MSDLRLELLNGYHLSGFAAGDEDALVAHLGDGRIGEMIPVLPHPYGPAHAEWWVRHRVAFRTRTGVETTFAIRDSHGRLVGSVGVDDYPVGVADSAELGYWVAPAERGRGVATAAATAFVSYAFTTIGLTVLTSQTLSCNAASTRILERLGFEYIETKKQHTSTRLGRFDTHFYRLTRDRGLTVRPGK
jgi:RimJ/RimL family protein N-acetyltransferase